MAKYGGRGKGTPNKNTLPLQQLADKLGCSPFEILCRFAIGDAKGLGYTTDIVEQTTPKGDILEKPLITPELRVKAASEAAQYLYPKRKAIEHSGEITSVQVEKLKPEQINSILRGDPFLNEGEAIKQIAPTVAATAGGTTDG